MKKFRKMLLFIGVIIVFCARKDTAYATSTISYEYINGQPLAGNPTDLSSASDFINAKAAIESSDKILAFLYDTCKSASSPSDITSDSTVTVVTEKSIGGADKHGTVGDNSDAIWFIYDDKLYITKKAGVSGKVTIADTSSGGGQQDVITSFSGTKSEVSFPKRFYSDLDGSGSGVISPTVGDEKKYADKEFYSFKESAEDTYFETLGERDDISISNVRVYHHNDGLMRPQGVPWIDDASSLKEIYLSDDIVLSGNMNGLFNANFSVIKNTNSTDDAELKDSVYSSLERVYLYCDMSKVSSTAGMFARCPKLSEIIVRTGAHKPMPNVVSTAYMFYGDKELKNGEDSFIQAMDLSGANSLESTEFMFGGCESIERPNVSSYHMDDVKWAKGMFFGSKNARLKTDGSGDANDIKGWKLSSLIDASAMFSGGDEDGEFNVDDPLDAMDPGLSEISDYGNVVTGTIDMSGWDMNSCRMAYMMFSRNGQEFAGLIFGNTYNELIDASGICLRCDFIGNLEMKAAMPKLKNATMMFKLAGSKASETRADLSGYKASNLKNADFMFYGAGFQSIDTTNIDSFSNVKSAKGMFGNCKNLQNLGEGALGTVKFSSLEDGKMMFIDDEALVKINTSGWRLDSIKDMSFMMQNTPNLSSGVDISSWGIGSSLLNMECFADGSAMSSYDYSSWNTANVLNYAFAFAGNTNLKTVVPATATSPNALLNAEIMFGMFSDDPSLITVKGVFPYGTKVKDVGGMFANDAAITTVNVANLVKTVGTNIAYYMKNCKSIEALDISGWNTSRVIYAQGFLDGAEKLKELKIGTAFSANSIKNAGTMLRNNYVLQGASINGLIKCFGASSELEDAYEMMKNDYALIMLDLSPMDFSNCVDLTRIAAMEANDSFDTKKLTTIRLPENILTAPGVLLKDENNSSINMFWIEGDETSDTDDVLTTLFLDGTPGNNILSYSYGGTNGDNDNRTFMKFIGRTINGNGVGTYSIKGGKDTALMDIDVSTTLYKGGITETTASLADIKYIWTKGGTNIAGATKKSYETIKSGTFVVKAAPSILKKENSEKSATFVVGATLKDISARYIGGEIPVGEEYSLDDVEVMLIDTDEHEIRLTADDYTVDSKKVSKSGDNEYNVIYKNGDKDFVATITVPGFRKVGAIDATYSGPSVVAGKEYDPDYVTVKAYYVDDPDKKNGFDVKPSELSSLKVTTAGDNTYTATYTDSKQGNKKFSAQYVVNGYKTISSIAASYTGEKVKIGDKYDKDDVKVTLYYADGSGSATTKNFTVDSETVTYEGGNAFTVSYRDPFGSVYTAGFSVSGYKDAKEEKAADSISVPENDIQVITTSTVNAPSNKEYSASRVKKGVSTGIVQTGTTKKAMTYAIITIGLIVGIIVCIEIRKKMKENEKG